MPNRVVIHTYLWSLRAEIEQQLRRLTRAQQHVDALAFATKGRETEASGLVTQLEEIIESTIQIREQGIATLGEARMIQQRVADGDWPAPIA
jgi:hypothetical protein